MACKGTVPSFAVSIGAAVRRRFRRLFQLNRSTPCSPQATPAGRPVRSAPFQGSCGSCAKAGDLSASPLKRSLLLAMIPASPLLKICFFTLPQRIRPVPQAARLPARRSVFRFKYRRRQPRGIQRRRGNGFLRNAGKAHAHTLFTARGNSGNASALPTASPQSAP